MKKVSTAEILREIYGSRKDIIDAYRRDRRSEVVYNLSNFTDDMRRHELVVDRRTIRDKWSILVTKGVIREEYPGAGYLQIRTFTEHYLESTCGERVRETKHYVSKTSIGEGVQ